jgi:hypothetical protein
MMVIMARGVHALQILQVEERILSCILEQPGMMTLRH